MLASHCLFRITGAALLITTLGAGPPASTLAIGAAVTEHPGAAAIPTDPNLKVAFISDGGFTSSTRAVLQLIKSEGADMVIHSGDFDYENNPTGWDSLITSVLGSNFPYFASVGDGDLEAWPGYQKKLGERLGRVKGATLTGDLGVRSACTYRGLFFILSGVGTLGSNHEGFIHDQLNRDRHIWKVCSWHKNQEAMQVGGKTDEVGWPVYEEGIREGAIIATGHEHSYARTRTLTNAEHQTVDPVYTRADTVCVGSGRSFVIQCGLGGRSIRRQRRCLPASYPYGCNGEWADIYTRDQNADFGALFIVFSANGDPNRARGYFKNILGVTVDSFTIVHSRTP